MNKKQFPFSEPTKLRLAFASDFSSFGIVHNKLVYIFKDSAGWFDVPVVPGTLRITSTPKDKDVFEITIAFRIAYSTILLSNFLNRFKPHHLVATYTSAGGEQRVAGTVGYPLKLSFRESENFDGYECTLEGTQNIPEFFL